MWEGILELHEPSWIYRLQGYSVVALLALGWDHFPFKKLSWTSAASLASTHSGPVVPSSSSDNCVQTLLMTPGDTSSIKNL